jgi:hypothetical protein
MKKVKLGNYKLEMYDSLDELPITRFHKYNKMLLVDAGVGSNIGDFDMHIERAIRFSKSNPEIVRQELENLRQSVYMIQEELNPGHLAFCALIKSINGKDCTDITDEGLKATHRILSSVYNNEMDKQLKKAKKKIEADLNMYFPELFDDADTKEYYDLLLKRTRLTLQSIHSDEDNEEVIDSLTTQMLLHNAPKKFYGTDSAEIVFDKQFEEMCLGIAKHLGVDAKKYTVLEYYSAFEYMKKDAKKINSNGRKSK